MPKHHEEILGREPLEVAAVVSRRFGEFKRDSGGEDRPKGLE